MSLLSVSALRAKLLRSAGWLLARQVITMFNALVLGVFIARHLGPEGFAVLNYAVSLVAIALPITTLGLRDMALREHSRHPEDGARILGTVAAMRVAGTLVAIAGIAFVSTVFPIDHEGIAILCMLVGVALLFQTIDTIKEQFIAEQNPRIFVIVNVTVLLAFTALKIGLIATDRPVDAFILAVAAETAVQGLAGAYAYYRKAGTLPRLVVDWTLMRGYARSALPLTISGISTVVYLKIDILFLSNMVSKEETGFYAVAARLSEAWYMLPATLAMAALPRMIEVRAESVERYNKRMQDAMDVFAVFGTLVAVTSIWWAGPVILFLFGPAYAGAIPLLQIQAWIGVVFATRQLIEKWLLTEGLFWGIAIVNLTGAVANIVLNTLLIPVYGAEGAAYATIASYALAPLLLAPAVRAIRPVAVMQIRSILWIRRIAGLRPGGREASR